MKNEQEKTTEQTNEDSLVRDITQSKFFENEMKRAFLAGHRFEILNTNGADIDPSTLEDKNLPFYEWFIRKYKD